MSGPDRDAEARRWLRYATEDLLAAETLHQQQTPSPRHICWLAQQAAEKSLKALLVFLQIEFPRTHDLDALCALVPERWTVRTKHPDLAELTEWSVEARYPGEWDDATSHDAREALTQARAVHALASADLASGGVRLAETNQSNG